MTPENDTLMQASFPYLLELGLTQNRSGMKVDLLLPVTGNHGGLPVDMHQIGIHAGHQCCFHHGPVLRVQIHIPDVTAPARSHKT